MNLQSTSFFIHSRQFVSIRGFFFVPFVPLRGYSCILAYGEDLS
jgi:hypothetical protein